MQMIQNVEYENAMLSSEELRVSALLDTVRSLSNLSVLSLPDCIDVASNQTIAADLNACLKVCSCTQTPHTVSYTHLTLPTIYSV